MEEVSKKYSNMIELCKRIDERNEWVIQIKGTSVELFLATIRKKMNENPKHNIESLYRDIINISKIDESIITPTDVVLVKRYIEYFQKISLSII